MDERCETCRFWEPRIREGRSGLMLSKERYAKEIKERQSRAKVAEKAAKASAEKVIAGFLFLSTPMPNGKALRYCTFAEWSSFSELGRRACKGQNPKALVSSVYRTDAELQKLYRP